ncbi:hypothetical protein NDU88_004221 [Pleurodeles waltl]|uniref:Uncharacterized protein n=1 Tax=Pleurodeles waltl TaxID=8319 RepID=A0AAV7NLN3_PLEWA|nr:hypothetical protein NDU88_004221 [Pleurodeles waltl]
MQNYDFYAHRALRKPWIVASALQEAFQETTSARGLVSVPPMKVLPKTSLRFLGPIGSFASASPATKIHYEKPLGGLLHSNRIVSNNQRETPYSASLATRLGGGFRIPLPSRSASRLGALSLSLSLAQPQCVTGALAAIPGLPPP